jgi:hypothetical protein
LEQGIGKRNMLRRASECVCMTGGRTTFSELEHLFRRQKRDLKVSRQTRRNSGASHCFYLTYSSNRTYILGAASNAGGLGVGRKVP